MDDGANRLALAQDSKVCQAKVQLVEGWRATEIVSALRERYPEDDPLIILSFAIEELSREGAETNHDLARGILINAYREIARRALDAGDFKSAVLALKSFERVSLK